MFVYVAINIALRQSWVYSFVNNEETQQMTNEPRPSYSADQYAAHEFLTELRTRIATQPLALNHGDEDTALTSLYQLFALAREAIKNNPGCNVFATLTVDMLNTKLRPVTAFWHRKQIDGALEQRDEAIAFRNALAEVRIELHAFANELHEMVYGTGLKDKVLTEPKASEISDVPLIFGIPETGFSKIEDAKHINRSERAEILKIRRANGKQTETDVLEDAVGLAFSGGGIRSASFCLGVVQVLAEKKILHDVDVMSTVSGGGFVGAFISQRLNGTPQPEEEGLPSARIAKPKGPDTEAIGYLRSRAAYISMGSFWGTFVAACRIIAGMILNWSAPAFLIALVSLICVLFVPDDGLNWNIVFALAATCPTLGLVIYAALVRITYVWAGRIFSALLGVGVLMILAWAVHWAYETIEDYGSPIWLVSIATAGATLPALSRSVPFLRHPLVQKTVVGVVLMLALLAIPLLAITLGTVLFDLGNSPYAPSSDGLSAYASGWVLLLIITVVLLAAAWSLDINLNAPHSFYRARLARTFVAQSNDTEQSVPLPDTNINHRAPYHLINATVNLPSSTAVSLRERKGDFFTMSKFWCGSPATGYHRTSDWKAGSETMDLATAVAISGAAVAPHMALLNIKSVSMLMSFLNLRLGYWIKAPGRNDITRKTVPGFWCLIKEMVGFGMSEKSAWYYLSDGGHIENLGVYELLRRRCKYIVAIDAGADADNRFGSLTTLIRHARIDLGIDISPTFNDLRVNAETGVTPAHGTLCKIKYPDGEGLLLVIKLAVTGDESELIKAYKLAHPDFPHQSTADQFYNEEQFEAYRQLGAHSAEGFFNPALIGSKMPPAGVGVWLRDLSVRLLS